MNIVNGKLVANKRGFMEKTTVKLVVLLCLVTLTVSCDIMGPPFPKKMAKEYFNSTKEDPDKALKVLNKGDMPKDDFIRFAKSDNKNVRYLIASNRHIPAELLEKLIEDPERYVRQGAASNTSIDKKMIDKLLKDSYCLVQSALVSNPSVPEDIILHLYKTKKITPVNFAENPHCPETIRQDILKSDDALAIKWLGIVDGWKKEGKFDEKGVWLGEN